MYFKRKYVAIYIWSVPCLPKCHSELVWKDEEKKINWWDSSSNRKSSGEAGVSIVVGTADVDIELIMAVDV